MGQKIFLRMWCRVNFYCTERVIYHVNTMKKKELIFYMMHEMRIVWYLQLGICLFFFLSPVFFFLKKRNHEWFSDWTVQTFLLCVCLRSRQSCCCLMCHSLFDPWPRKMSYYQQKKNTLFGSILLSLLRCIKKQNKRKPRLMLTQTFPSFFFRATTLSMLLTDDISQVERFVIAQV